MSDVMHHVPQQILWAHAAGALPYGFSVVVATHVSLCDACRAGLEAEEAVGGAVLDQLAPAALGPDLRARTLARLDDAIGEPAPPARSGIFPGPLVQALGGHPPRWRHLGGGIRQQILSADSEGSLRLLFIPPGTAVPEHGHRGLEMTQVLQGSFSDATGRFGVGDVQIADPDLDHIPTADPGQPCICLAATDAPLRFRSLLPRLLQPLFRI
jgi:putative transcriptional regulator